ncbi:helix-turn-helix domain-containing protein [Geoalkalibacter halelectricus]|uniref:helix-turn-helix domain-containing protein n=1 Tax=Geoalkalibacter halelectricus TaxID=2847045 RepID=UPI003D1ADF70
MTNKTNQIDEFGKATERRIKNNLGGANQPSLGELIRAIRLELGGAKESQRKMGEKAGVSRSMITHVENHNFILEDEHLQRIADAYGEDEFEKQLLLRKLRRAVVYTRNPKEFYSISLLPEESQAEAGQMRPDILPTALRARIEQTMYEKKIKTPLVAEQAKIDLELLWRAMSGEQPLTRDQAQRVCDVLGDNFSEWTLLMGRLPERLLQIAREKPLLCRVLALIEQAPGHLVQQALEAIEEKLDPQQSPAKSSRKNRA